MIYKVGTSPTCDTSNVTKIAKNRLAVSQAMHFVFENRNKSRVADSLSFCERKLHFARFNFLLVSNCTVIFYFKYNVIINYIPPVCL